MRTEPLGAALDRLGADHGPASARAVVDRLVREGMVVPLERGGRTFLVAAGDMGRHLDIAAAVDRRGQAWARDVDEAALAAVLAGMPVRLDPPQVDAVRLAVRHPLSAIVGGAGTGKSTVAVALSRYLRATEAGDQAVAAFSARIAERSGGRCGVPWHTCHALTGTRPGDEWSEGDPLPAGLGTLLVDEAFSVGPGILSRILRLAHADTRVVLLGDPGQLPPIEGGRPLHDLCEVGALPSTTLAASHRIRNPHLIEQVGRVNRGLVPLAGPGLEILVGREHGRSGDAAMARAAARAHRSALARGRTCVVLAPTRHGPAGHAAVATLITGREAPAPGDEVVTVAAHPKGLWRNGQTGVLAAGEDGGATIRLSDGRSAPVAPRDPRVAHACAMSAHRAQGLEYGEVVVILARSTCRDASRQLLSSAMTRAPACTLVVGAGVLEEVCRRDEVAERAPIIAAARGRAA